MKNEKAIFTIVTKSYLPQARTLGDSIMEVEKDLDYFILLADEKNENSKNDKEKYPIIEVKDIGIECFQNMAFKYELVEFCTAVKPFFFDYLFKKKSYKKIIYFDPDIYIYEKLDSIFNLLNDHFVVLTPHLTEIENTDGGTKPDDDYLKCGVFNLGFIALNNSQKGEAILSWWKTKTKDKGYADFADGLYVDQKWADMIPCFADEGVYIARHPGYNLAHWNMHQRKLCKDLQGYKVNGQPLIFFHFSGFDPRKPAAITRPHGRGPVTLKDKPEYRELFEDYREKWLKNKIDHIVESYAYSHFDNGVQIFSFHRRLYRKLLEQKIVFENPFSTDSDSFYNILKKNKLLIMSNSIGEFRMTNIPNFESKLKLIIKLMNLLKKFIGIKKYHLLLRVLNTLCRPEEQTFLLETLNLDLPIQFR